MRYSDHIKASAACAVALTVLAGCGSSSSNSANTGSTDAVTDPVFAQLLFGSSSATVDNPNFPLVPGSSWTLEGLNDEGALERTVTTVSHETRTVDGVKSAVVLDREYEDGELVEETFDWYAQDTTGNVWYMGEASVEFDDGQSSTGGSWESGLDIDGVGSVATAGIIMKATPTVGDRYVQESYPGVAEDTAEITSLAAPVQLATGNSYSALQIKEWNPVDADTSEEFKYYASGVGLLIEETTDGMERIERISESNQTTPNISATNFSNSLTINNSFFPLVVGDTKTYQLETDEGTELIVIEVLNETREVMGIATRVVRDTVTLDGVLIEDTFDWFAQDNEGVVWYFGEEVVNYIYDDNGVLLETNNDSAWESGVDGALPGIQMLAAPRAGDSYRQEYYLGEAEDLAAIAELNVNITLDDGRNFTALKIREWNPLEAESGDEYKFYAPGVGLIREEDDEGERADLQ